MFTHGGVFGRASLEVIVHVLKSGDVAMGILIPVPELSVAKAYHVEPAFMMEGSGKFWVMTGPFTEGCTEDWA